MPSIIERIRLLTIKAGTALKNRQKSLPLQKRPEKTSTEKHISGCVCDDTHLWLPPGCSHPACAEHIVGPPVIGDRRTAGTSLLLTSVCRRSSGTFLPDVPSNSPTLQSRSADKPSLKPLPWTGQDGVQTELALARTQSARCSNQIPLSDTNRKGRRTVSPPPSLVELLLSDGIQQHPPSAPRERRGQ